MIKEKVTAKRDGLRYLMQALYTTIGNKVYLRDLEELLEDRLQGISAKDEETLLYLARDISNAR